MTTATKKRVKLVLKKARALIVLGWTRGAFARSRTRRAVKPESPDAVCFCSVGAIIRSSRGRTESIQAQHVLRDCLPDGPDRLSRFNDDPKRKKSEVLALFDRAIEACERGGAL